MRQTLVAGNWKMNGSRESIKTLLAGIKAGIGDVKSAELAVCCPAVYISDVSEQLAGTGIAFGGQDISTHDSGAYTGEIAASMWNDFNCKYVIIGHSERRTYHNESDDLVAEKFEVARKAGLSSNGDWCHVNKRTLESLHYSEVYVLGDANDAAQHDKNAFSAVAQADAFVRAIAGRIV